MLITSAIKAEIVSIFSNYIVPNIEKVNEMARMKGESNEEIL